VLHSSWVSVSTFVSKCGKSVLWVQSCGAHVCLFSSHLTTVCLAGGSLVMQVWGAPEEVIKSSKTQIASVEVSELGRKEVINPLVDDFSTETNRLEKPTNGNVH
jgi:hypothetical protein